MIYDHSAAKTTSYQMSSSVIGADEGNISRGLSIPFSILMSPGTALMTGVRGGIISPSSSRSTGPSGRSGRSFPPPSSSSHRLREVTGRDRVLADLADLILADLILSPASPNLDPRGVGWGSSVGLALNGSIFSPIIANPSSSSVTEWDTSLINGDCSVAMSMSSSFPPLVSLSITEEMCFFTRVVSVDTSKVIGVAPWFSLPGLASDVLRMNVNAASVVSCHP